ETPPTLRASRAAMSSSELRSSWEPPTCRPSPSRLALDLLGSSRQMAVEDHGNENRRTDDGLEPKPVNSQQLNPILQNGEDHGAESRTINRPAASEDAYTSHHDRRDRL